MFTAFHLSLAFLLPFSQQVSPTTPVTVHDEGPIPGPVLGDLRPDGAKIWLYLGDATGYGYTLTSEGYSRGVGGGGGGGTGDPMGGFNTTVVQLNGLSPATSYQVTLQVGDDERVVEFTTPAPHDDVDHVRIAFGSCASHDRFESQPIWTAIAKTEPTALVLLGDTPYIDSTDLEHQRTRYREFWSIPELVPLAASVPVYSTWDDHDFATNDQVGAQPGREYSRRAFVEYHAQPSFGDGKLGIDTSFRSGPVEVFLIDTRWYGDEERWETGDAEGELTSLLGRRQREALIAAVSASTADIKVLTCGMVWNGAVRPNKRDHWGTWAHERDAIFRALRDKGVRGVVLVGGDIHRPRVIRHLAAKEHLGYVPVELISSPLANHPIATAAAPHPGLVWDAEASSVALILDVTRGERGPQVVARFIGPAGDELHVHSVAASDLGY